ncbi:MAG: hypothetical protein HKO68_17930 [Desulfobacterales bacterium]|nr:hypothetical protein [Desulfobacterales bacterium]
MVKYLHILIGMIAFLIFQSIVAAQHATLQNSEIIVYYEPSLKSVAAEIVRLYPILKQELEEMFGWSLPAKPQVVVVKKNQSFQKIARNKLFVAFALPEKNLIVVDNSRVNIRPFTLNVTLKHELCHLLLHSHISDENLVRWFDEGICQWVSDGMGEIFIEKSWSGLDAAIVAGRHLPLVRLTKKFPQDKASLILAYEQSKSVVAYINKKYGENAVLNLLGHLKNGATMDAATQKSLGVSIDQLEKEWLKHLERTPRWLVYLANNLYAILFFLAALLTIFGFIKRLARKRAWDNEEREE